MKKERKYEKINKKIEEEMKKIENKNKRRIKEMMIKEFNNLISNKIRVILIFT